MTTSIPTPPTDATAVQIPVEQVQTGDWLALATPVEITQIRALDEEEQPITEGMEPVSYFLVVSDGSQTPAIRVGELVVVWTTRSV